MVSNNKNWEYDLDEYIREGEPDKVEKTKSWKAAIGLQDVDGLKTSSYLLDTAKDHIEGKIAEAENKEFQSRLAVECGINIPQSISFEKESVYNVIENWNLYPCIIKPIDSVNGGKNDIHICNDAKETIKKVKKK